MTLIIKPGQVINTESTDIKIGAQVNVGGSFHNEGLVEVRDTGNLTIKGDIKHYNSGRLNIGEKKSVLKETITTIGKIAELGSEILKK